MASLTFTNIARAAIDQNWCVERTSKQHRRLIPPDKSKPIVIAAGTTGDPRAVRHFLSQMRLSGFVWPWPPNSGSSANGSNGSIRVSTVHEMSGENMADMRERLIEQRPSMESELPSGDDIQDQWIPVVADRLIAPGYMMNIDGDVRSPSGNVLTPELKGRQLWVGFKPLNARGYRTKRSRLDKVVLLTWVGEPVDSDAQPIHANGDALDCRPDNLRWPCDVKPVDGETRIDAESVATSSGSVSVNGTHPTPVDEPDDTPVSNFDLDDVSVKFVLGNHGIDLVGVFDSAGGVDDYSIIAAGGRIDDLSGDDLKALAAIIARWQRVADHL